MNRESNMAYPIWVGWIYGDPEDRATLRKLGVKGEMVWSPSDNSGSLTRGADRKRGIFEHCECTAETLDRLERDYPVFWRGSFTETDERMYRIYRRQFKVKCVWTITMLRALPTWLLTCIASPFFPRGHPWRGARFSLCEWYVGQTRLCMAFDLALWSVLLALHLVCGLAVLGVRP